MIDYIHNRDGRATSTQVSRMDDITEDVFTPEFYFLIKNTNDNEVTVEIRPAGQENFITTVLYPGWNTAINTIYYEGRATDRDNITTGISTS